VSNRATGKYYASCLFEGEQGYRDYQEKDEKAVSLDMPMQNFSVDSLGNSPDYQCEYRLHGKKLGKAQKQLARNKALWKDQTVVLADKRFARFKMCSVCEFALIVGRRILETQTRHSIYKAMESRYYRDGRN
jgi:hypothetical protein